MTQSVAITDVVVTYGGGPVLDRFDLHVKPGELLAILGPSGCGKSTLLNLVAGFVRPSAGRVFVGERDVTNLPPQGRALSMVFQNYALFPHMTVFANVAYGLQVRRLPQPLIAEKVQAMLKTVGLEGYDQRYPRQLSGGQQQRVALARAMAVEPEVLLLDEPLSNLDAKLRREMRAEIKQLQRRLQTTTILVTHDQDEALSLADRVAVMQGGKIQQLAEPWAVYNTPTSHFVAEFVGRTNSFRGVVARNGSEASLHCGEAENIPIDAGDIAAGRQAVAVIRPEVVRVLPPNNGEGLAGTVRFRGFVGSSWECEIALDGGGVVVAIVAAGQQFVPAEGDRVTVAWDKQDVILLPES